MKDITSSLPSPVAMAETTPTDSAPAAVEEAIISTLDSGSEMWVGEKLTEESVRELVALVWGPTGPEQQNLHRWSQGFAFSSSEPTALLQLHGGPCAIIAPVQAYLLKNAIYGGSHSPDPNWRARNGNEVLADALIEMFSLLGAEELIVLLPSDTLRIPSKRDATAMEGEGQGGGQGQGGGKREGEVGTPMDSDTPFSPSDYGIHSDLKFQRFSSLEVLKKFLLEKPAVFCSSFGVLRFLYSLILSKKIGKVKEDLEDPTEPLIDGVHGHGNQCLTNLLITGKAIGNVWDDVKEFSGLRLQGISGRPAIGFLSLLESMRYVEVGFYLKCPKFPIWILGSETHLSILFTLVPSLVTSESEEAAAVRAFKTFDEHGSGFIATDKLVNVLETLDLFREDDYVTSLKEKMDKDKLNIILRSDFLSEFFPQSGKFNQGRPFDVYHYNGLARSDSSVRYHHGVAKIIELDLDVEIIEEGGNVNGVDSDSSIVRCLRTKYPRVEIIWDEHKIPSIN